MSDKERAISLIQKVLAKTNNNPSQQEVETAMLKAQELLVKYGLTMEDVTVQDEKVEKEVVREDVTEQSGRTAWWIKILGNIIADNFRCSSFTRMGYNKSNILFVGLKEDVQIAKEVFNFMRVNIDYLSKQYIINLCNEINNMHPSEKPLKYQGVFLGLKHVSGEKNDYIRGFLSGLDAKFKEQVEKNNWGLILVKDDAVVEYIDNMNTVTRKQSSVKSSYDSSHFDKGYEDGKSTDYNKKLINE